jgi:hypothetical protein
MTSLKNWTQAHRSTSGNSFIPSSTNLSSIFVSLDAITTSKFMLHWLLLLPHTPLPICRVILLRSPYFHCAYTLELCCWATRWVGTEEWWLLFFFNAKGFLSGLSERPRPHPPNVRHSTRWSALSGRHGGCYVQKCGWPDASRWTSLDVIFPEDVQSDNPTFYCNAHG